MPRFSREFAWKFDNFGKFWEMVKKYFFLFIVSATAKITKLAQPIGKAGNHWSTYTTVKIRVYYNVSFN